jgi:cytochrome c oxidase cbb3-type subunit 3
MNVCRYQPNSRAGLAALLLVLLAGCEQEQRPVREGPADRLAPAGTSTTGQPQERQAIANPYESQVHAINEGRRLYAWFNCNGCHAAGSEPAEIFATIMEGRPQGMPSFRGRIPEDDVWKIVAFVRSLSGLGTKLPEGAGSTPLQDESSGNLDQGPEELKQYYKEAGDD